MEQAPIRNSVFISYARENKRYLDELHDQLAFHVRSGAINAWDDTHIRPGTLWRDEITRELQAARIAIFLVSASLLASDFVAEFEMPPLLEAARKKEVTILSVILSACMFNDTELSLFQAMNEPSQPLDQMAHGKRALIWTKTVKSVKAVLKEST